MPNISGWTTGEPVASTDINTYLLRGNRNAIINGDFRINQRAATSATDDVFFFDRWTLLSDAATITTTQSTTAPTDGKYSCALTPSTTNKKFGIIQYVENLNCVGMFGQMVTLSFKAKVSATTNLSNIKAGIVSWTGTADSLTSDIVSAWNTGGTTPTLISGWTFENTPANLNVTTSWVTYRVQGLIDTASAANVAAFIWCDTTTATGSDTLYITDVQLEIGAVATPFERRPMQQELAMCQRYYYKITGGSLYYPTLFTGGIINAATNANRLSFILPVPLRRDAVVADFAFAAVSVYDGTTSQAITSITNFNHVASGQIIALDAVTNTGLTVGRTGIGFTSPGAGGYASINVEL